MLINQEKSHAVFTTAVTEPLTHYKANTDSSHEGRSDLAVISVGPPMAGKLNQVQQNTQLSRPSQ